MKIRTLLNKATEAVHGWHPHVTRTKLLLFAITLVLAGLMLGALEPQPERGANSYTHQLNLDLPETALPAFAEEAGVVDAGPLAAPPEDWEMVEVKSGQTLDSIFRKQGFSVGLLHQILALNGDTKSLTKIRPGDVFAFQRYEDGSLKRMRYPIDEASYLLVESEEDNLYAQRLERQIFTEVHHAEGVIDSSLFLAGKAAGLRDGMIMQLANIFGWDIDFVLDIRAGDRFFLIYEKVYREGEYLRDGEIIGATFVNQGERFQALRYQVDGNSQYFAPDGRPMRKAFLRAPLNFSYISSNFNPKRFHPILKRVKAHNGIDYRAPTGTPVYAAGEGTVIRSAYDKYNGHHVFIQHPNNVVTKYLHFTKRTVNNGQRVQQGKVIGFVGSTGMSTAPHLHYEFVVNGVHRNPRTVPLPKVEPLEGNLLADFQTQAAPVQNQLSRMESASLYAARE